jgi:hypothetical protein
MKTGCFRENAQMKKKAAKKIVLTKETLRNLEDREASLVNGGISGSACGNDTCYILCKTSEFC